MRLCQRLPGNGSLVAPQPPRQPACLGDAQKATQRGYAHAHSQASLNGCISGCRSVIAAAERGGRHQFARDSSGRGGRGRQSGSQYGGRGGRGRGRRDYEEEEDFGYTSRRRRGGVDNEQEGYGQKREVAGLREKQEFFAGCSWKQAGASQEVVEALETLGIHKPSHVQAESYAALMSGAKHVVVADHAGSGKTLAYLLPFIQSMQQEERTLGEGVKATKAYEPRVVVVCPTEELCAQVVMICRAVAKVIRFRSGALTGGHKLATHKSMLKEGVDLVVCTPGRLAQLMEAEVLKLTNCRGLILDEVDVLLGDQGAFAEQVSILASHAGEDTRVVLVTATLPEPTFNTLKDKFPGLVAAIGPNLHRTATGITETLVDCSGGTDMSQQGGTNRKLAALLGVMQRNPVARTIVFCNKIETCRDVENFVRRHDKQGTSMVALPYHAAVDAKRRTDHLKSFLRPPQPNEPRRVLICTDRASRGIDSAYTEHVVLFDFPRDPSEYVRRVGRTARGAMGRGEVSVLVMGRQVKLAQEIIDRNQKGLPVHTVPSAQAFGEDGAIVNNDWMR